MDEELRLHHPELKEGQEIIIYNPDLAKKKIGDGTLLLIHLTDETNPYKTGEFFAQQVSAQSVYLGYKSFAEEFILLNPIHFDVQEYWWVWKHSEYRYVKTDELHIMILVESSLFHAMTVLSAEDTDIRKAYNTLKPGTKSQIIEAIKRISRKTRPELLEWHYVQFKDTIYNLLNGQSFEASPKYFITNPIPWKVGSSEESPMIDKLFTDWTGSQKVLLEELTAACTIPGHIFSRIFWLYGEGSNGKGQYLKLNERFIGGYNTTSITDLALLAGNQFQSSRLHKKLVCAIGEVDGKKIDKTSILKSITGGDKIGLELKGKDLFEDYIYAKVIIAANVIPESIDNSKGWFRRALIIDFPNEFSKEKDVLSEIPDIEFENLAAKSLRILRKLVITREFTGEGDFLQKRERYESRSNPLKKFFELYIEDSVESQIPTNDFQDRFNTFCEKNGYRGVDFRVLGRRVKADFGIEKAHPTIMGERTWVYTGIRWKDEDKPTVRNKIIGLLEKNESLEVAQLEGLVGAHKDIFDSAIRSLVEHGEIVEQRSGVYSILK